jgi:hypothetical protein
MRIVREWSPHKKPDAVAGLLSGMTIQLHFLAAIRQTFNEIKAINGPTTPAKTPG